MKAGIVASSYVVPSGGGGFDPSDLTGLVGWWDASDAGSFTFYSGALVQQWNDRSGNGYHLTTGSSTTAPTRGTFTLNSLDTVTCDGVDNYIRRDGSNIVTGTTLSVCALFRIESFGGLNSRVVSFNKDGESDWQSVASTAAIYKSGTWFPSCERNGQKSSHQALGFEDTWIVVMSIFNGTNHTMYVDGVAKTPVGSTGTFDVDEMWFGGPSYLNEFSNVTFAEIVVTSAALTTGERTDLRNYLIAKWGL